MTYDDNNALGTLYMCALEMRAQNDSPIVAIAVALFDELRSAMEKYPPFASPHEGSSVLREEFEELWEHVKTKQGNRDVPAMYREAVQVIAMAYRFALDCASSEEKGQR